MAKINYINSRKDAQWAFKLNNGKLIEVMNKEGHFMLRYDTPFNLKTRHIYEGKRVPKTAVTLNSLRHDKQGDTIFCYDEHKIRLGFIRSLTEKRIGEIMRKFKKAGFNVTKEAILHNYDAWCLDMKSGYRDEENGYHLFSPCGCNPFDLRASTLEECCADWQTTYKC